MRQIAVIGLGNFGQSLALGLVEQGAQVVAIDKSKERVEAIKESVTYAVTLNSTDENALRAAGVQDVDVAVVSIGDDIEGNLLTTLLLKKVGVKRIWARAISPLQKEILSALQVDSIINLEEEMGRIVARSLILENVVKQLHLGSGSSVAEISVTSGLAGRTLRDLDLRKAYALNVVAIRTRVPRITDTGERTFSENTDHVPSPDTELREGDVMIVAGRDEDIARFSRSET